MNHKSYIISNFKTSKATWEFIDPKLRGLSGEQRRFFLHVLCSHLLELRRKRYEILPGYDTLGLKIPFATIKAEFERGFSWERDGKALKPFIEASDFYTGECRYFQVVPALLDEILAHIETQVLSPDGSPAVNLFTGLAYNIGQGVTRDGAHPSSKLMRDAMRVLHATECPINVAAIQSHIDRLKAEGKVLILQNDRLCAQAMFAGLRQGQPGCGYYVPSYSPQSSGRIGEQGGGVQSCSRAMKEAAFTGLNVFNYDLRSSQGYALRQELRLAGIDDGWVADHLGPGVFEQRANHLSLPKGLYKKCFFSTIMGATHVWLEGEHVGAIQEGLLENLGDSKLAQSKFKEVVAQLKPLKAVVGKWASWLLDDPACPHRKLTQRREVLQNAAGQSLVLDRSRPARDLKGEAAAHILQGQEAAYVHHLTVLSKEFGFLPVSNQHDGLVTVGEVPAEAQKMAAARSGFKGAFLEQKAFV